MSWETHLVEAHSQSKRLTWVLIGVGSAIIVLLVAIFAVLVAPSEDEQGDDATTFTSESARTFVANGTLRLIGDVDGTNSDCYGAGGFSDIQAGAQVVIRNASGDTVALGELDQGTVPKGFGSKDGLLLVMCDWSFTVSGIPSGSSAYSVEVSHRGEIAFTENTASAISLSLS